MYRNVPTLQISRPSGGYQHKLMPLENRHPMPAAERQQEIRGRWTGNSSRMVFA
jgi:hypothetical protein